MIINKRNDENNQPTPEQVSENIRSVAQEIIKIQSKLLAIRNENYDLLNEISKTAIAQIYLSEELAPADVLVALFSRIENQSLEILRKQK
jgi:hypothetical protein